MTFNSKILTIVFVLLAGFVSTSFAQTKEHPLATNEEKALRDKSKNRKYPGGKDEENLKVQAQLPQFHQKVTVEELEYGIDQPEAQ